MFGLPSFEFPVILKLQFLFFSMNVSASNVCNIFAICHYEISFDRINMADLGFLCKIFTIFNVFLCFKYLTDTPLIATSLGPLLYESISDSPVEVVLSKHTLMQFFARDNTTEMIFSVSPLSLIISNLS